MAASELKFTKTWTSSADFPTYEPDEAQVRADMQLLFDEIKNHINTVLLPDLLKRVPDTRKVNGHALADDVSVTKGDVGLGNVDNTSDADKPVSTAQQAALDKKADKSNVLQKDNTEEYVPTQPFHPSTKGYADQILADAVLGTVPDGSIGSVKLTPELNEHIDQKMPVGGIIMWSGASNAIPSGWALCDGQNGTPDLRGRFIIGAGGSYQTGNSGGAESKQLTIKELPSHTHVFSGGTAATSGSHTHSDNFSISSDGSHSHGFSYTGASDKEFTSGNTLRETLAQVSSETGTTSSGGLHSHSLFGSISNAGEHTHTVTGTIGNTGSGNAFSILPPYYALCFIMKL